jgi:hypothetical protein
MLRGYRPLWVKERGKDGSIVLCHYATNVAGTEIPQGCALAQGQLGVM